MDLSIIVIEYNSLSEIHSFQEHLKGCLKGLDYELIVSSNSLYNSEKQAEILKEYPDLRWTFNERNGGFAYGMNRGLEIAQGDYLMIANSDVMIKSGMPEAVDFLRRHSDVGALGPAVKDENGVLQDSARPYVTICAWLCRQIRRAFGKTGKFKLKGIQTVDWLIGACIIMSREAYARTKGLDEHYFMYAEDLDFCTRIRQHGKEIVYFPPMQVRYKGTRSARHSFKYAVIFIKSHLHYWKKFGFFTIHAKRKAIKFE